MIISTYTVGLIVRRQFRHWLNSVKLAGWPIEWVETKGWIESQFAIKSTSELFSKLDAAIADWNAL